MPPAIRVENLGKQYLLGEFERYSTLRETIARAVTRPALRLAHRLRTALLPAPRSPLPAPGSPLPAPCSQPEFIWALRDVSFEVQHGEVLGIIGPNGAGKSTLLKILSRITEPTTGYAEIHGRVGSLLEVGTGFHPELTGRENVYLNGAILGMSRAEIRRKFDDIVSFAGVEKFIDTPVKRYSSGMQVRLAFAVAAHLDPEILIIDEVLAVGDAEFQKRCLGKMDEVSRSGRTILFVSHNMAAVEGLCTRAVWLEDGAVRLLGLTTEVVSAYLSRNQTLCADIDLRASHNGRAKRTGVIQRVLVRGPNGEPTNQVPVGGELRLIMQASPSALIRDAAISIRLYSQRGDRVMTLSSEHQYPARLSLCPGTQVCVDLRNCRLLPGTYSAVMAVKDRSMVIQQEDLGPLFEVIPCNVYGTGRMLPPQTGYFAPEGIWFVEPWDGSAQEGAKSDESLVIHPATLADWRRK